MCAWRLQTPEEGSRSPGTITDCCEPACECWDQTEMLLGTEPSPHPSKRLMFSILVTFLVTKTKYTTRSSLEEVCASSLAQWQQEQLGPWQWVR